MTKINEVKAELSALKQLILMHPEKANACSKR
jgi:hypothetical protein